MVKVKVKNYILFFLLLSMGCNNTDTGRFQDVALALSKGNLLGKSLVKMDLLTEGLLIEEGLFEKDVLKRELVEVDGGKSDLKKGTGENSVVKVDVGSKKVDAELEDDIELKIQNLLDEFKLSDQQRAIIMDLKCVLTDPSIGNDEGYKTYSREEFYDLLNHTGNANSSLMSKVTFVDSMTAYIMPIFYELREIEGFIEHMEDGERKQAFGDKLTLKLQRYQLGLKGCFTVQKDDSVYIRLLSNLYTYGNLLKGWFRDIKDDDASISEFEKIYAEMSVDEQEIIDYMRSVAMKNYTGFMKDRRYLYNHDEIGSYRLLVEFGATRLKKICDVLKVIVEARVAVANIKDRSSVLYLGLSGPLYHYMNGFAAYLKGVFNLSSSVDEMYTKILDSFDGDKFNLYNMVHVKERALAIIESEKEHGVI
ncbi:hypothetical protein baBA2_000981 (plasmid) [Borrelia anserina]|nr:hypothetical protein [Borrelia anserina]APR65387.1 hypothetical protein N187_A68 [Borrelia anserina Es]UPA07350.1 hypothetical protein baBA2_000981 [Borrelia anserina]